nr:2639_t:CDS:2 [Entrophospora candida]
MSNLNNLLTTLAHLNAGNNTRISVKIPSYKGGSNENVVAWLQTIFQAQGTNKDTTEINYAVMGSEAAALHWCLNRVMAAGEEASFADWNAFATAIRKAFQPPNYQHHLHQQLK